MTPNDFNLGGKLPPRPSPTTASETLNQDMTRLPRLDPRNSADYDGRGGYDPQSQDHEFRQPGLISLAILGVIIAGIVIGALFTMAILSGWIEIEPRAIKSVLKSLFGKGP